MSSEESSKEERRLWIAQCLSDIFLPSDTRPELPLTAWNVLEEGMTEQELTFLWQQLAPVLVKAGDAFPDDGSPLDPDWLRAQLQSAPKQGTFGRLWARVGGASDPHELSFQTLLRCRRILEPVALELRAGAARTLHDMAEIYLAIPGGADQIVLEGFSEADLPTLTKRLAEAFAPLLPKANRKAAQARLLKGTRTPLPTH